jgi:hypothetical protein
LATVEDKLKKGYYSELTPALGFGTVEAWELTGEKLPAGEWRKPPWSDPDEEMYFLNDPLPLEQLGAVCKGKDKRQCFLQSAWFYILPLDPEQATFHPFPEGVDVEEVVYDPFVGF